MAESVNALVGDAIAAIDGELGRVEEVFFDDREWRVCYLVVDAYAPLSGRKVLVSTDSVDRARTTQAAVGVRLTRAEVARGPSADSKMPVSRLYEEASARYYRGTSADVSGTEREAARSHLRSSRELIGYSVHGPHGLLGHLEDLLLEESGWSITGLVIDAPERRDKLRVSSESVRAIEWKTREVRVG